jgi:cell division protein FtsW
MGSLLFISLQAIINMGVVTGSMPTKGMSLPFISYGGSNLMVTFVFLGIIINVFRKWDCPKVRRPREIREI